MNYIICALAVYKTVQILEAISPRETMPWVKVVVGTILSYASIFVIHFKDRWLAGLVVATLAGAVHTLLRLLTLTGDMVHKKSIK
jgi:hypothetical protein